LDAIHYWAFLDDVMMSGNVRNDKKTHIGDDIIVRIGASCVNT
jgi:hypothetical protein